MVVDSRRERLWWAIKGWASKARERGEMAGWGGGAKKLKPINVLQAPWIGGGQ
jgi:hypothetical protein